MRRKFIVVYLDTLQRMKPLEAIIYALVLPYTERGIDYTTTYAALSKLSGATFDQIRRAIERLRERGELKMVRRQYDMILRVNQQNGKNDKSELQNGKNDKSDGVQNGKNDKSDGVQNGKNAPSEWQNPEVSHYLNNIINNRENINIIPPFQNGKNDKSDEEPVEQVEEVEQPTLASIEQRRIEIILQCIAEQYRERGDIYVPNFTTQTTSALSLIRKIEVVMQHYNIADTDEQFADVWRRFLKAGYESGDQFQREHWTLDYIDKQFMTIYNKINGNYGTKQSTNNTAKGQRRISNERLQRAMRDAGIKV